MDLFQVHYILPKRGKSMSGKETKYYEIRKRYLWIVIGIMLSIIVITYFRHELLEIWQHKQGIEDVSYEGIKSVLEDHEECYLCGSSDRSLMGYYRNLDTIGLISLNDWYVVVSLPEDYRPDIQMLQEHLCQTCLDKITDSLKTSKWKYEKKQAIPLCLVDFKTLEIYSLQDGHVGCSIRDYWVDMEYDGEKVEVHAYYLPRRE